MNDAINYSKTSVFAKRNLDTGATVSVMHRNASEPKDLTTLSPNKKSSGTDERPSHKHLGDRWLVMFERLAGYKAKYGHCLVPNRYKEDPPLGAWVSNQRRLYRRWRSSGGSKRPMGLDRIRMLDGLGFAWETMGQRQVPWETRFMELVEFRHQHGHSLVPMAYKRNPKLANWVSAQRQEGKNFRDGRRSRLSNNKIAMLSSIGFVWQAPKGASSPIKRLRFQRVLDSSQQKRSMSTVFVADNSDSLVTSCRLPSAGSYGKKDAVAGKNCSIPKPTKVAFNSSLLTRGNGNSDQSSLMLHSSQNAGIKSRTALTPLSRSLAEAHVDVASRRFFLQEQRLRNAISSRGERIQEGGGMLSEHRNKSSLLSLLSVTKRLATQEALIATQRAMVGAELKNSCATTPSSQMIVSANQPQRLDDPISRAPLALPAFQRGVASISGLMSAAMQESFLERSLRSSLMQTSLASPRTATNLASVMFDGTNPSSLSTT